MTTFTLEQVKKIAKLVNLDVETDAEILGKMLEETIAYIDILNELDTKDLVETYQVNGNKNIFQKDDFPRRTLTQTAALTNAKTKTEKLFSTKGVFDREK